jgi:alpha-glucosidase (family GH31 glycosyl hydrolase)
VSIGPGRLEWGFSDGRTNRELHDVFATLYHQPYRDALDAGSTEGGFLLVRASAWGGQTVADVIWPGDLDNDLSRADDTNVGGLPAAISALTSLAASGFPSFASDTGGYRDGRPTREALLRWAEHTAFSPFLQLGGGGESHNPWSYDAEAGAIYARLARAHMDLVPTFRMLARRASRDGTPPVLHPAMAYPDDRAGYADPDAYLVGDDLFVAVVTEPGATSRRVHLPPGRWVHWFTGQEHTGDVTVAAPLGEPPVFVRVGAILLLAPSDLDTLAEEDVDPALVTPSDRPYVRARVLPGSHLDGSFSDVRGEDGLHVAVRPFDAGDTALNITVSAESMSTPYDVRMSIELDHAEPVIDPARIGSLTVGASTLVPPAADGATVEAGCDGVCWFLDGTTLLVSARGTGGVPLLRTGP